MEQNSIAKVNNETESRSDMMDELSFDTPDKILSYGEEATNSVSKFADEILSRLSISFAEESSVLLTTLAGLMERFNMDDFEIERSKGFFSKLFNKSKRSTEDLYEKYASFSKEIDKIFKDIKKYETEIKETNEMLDNMYEENSSFYANIEKCVQTAKKYLEEKIDPIIEELAAKAGDASNGSEQIELGKYQEIKDTLEQRIYDLEMAKAVSLQTAPQIKLIQKGNYNLIRKINSAFVITMPLFKQGIIQAITIKRQKLHMNSMKTLDERTNRLLMQNAYNIVENTKTTVKMNVNSSVQIETIEKSYYTIINGIKEVEQLQMDNRRQRMESAKKLEEIKNALITGEAIRSEEVCKVS